MWLFLCFQKILFTKHQELKIQDSEVILLFHHLRQLLSQFFFSSGFFPHSNFVGSGKVLVLKTLKSSNIFSWHQLKFSGTQSD